MIAYYAPASEILRVGLQATINNEWIAVKRVAICLRADGLLPFVEHLTPVTCTGVPHNKQGVPVLLSSWNSGWLREGWESLVPGFLVIMRQTVLGAGPRGSVEEGKGTPQSLPSGCQDLGVK